MPTRARRKSVKVSHLHLPHERFEARGERVDHFWEGMVQIDEHTFPALFHVWRDDAFSKQPGWWYSLEINPEKRWIFDDAYMCDSCEKCSGEYGDGASYPGAVAMALYKAFVDFGRARGFPPVVDHRNGWFTFEMLCDLLSPAEIEFNYRLQCVEYRKHIDCAIHGPHTKIIREWSA